MSLSICIANSQLNTTNIQVRLVYKTGPGYNDVSSRLETAAIEEPVERRRRYSK